MSSTHIQTSFVSGELSPKLFGRVDLAKFHSGAGTMRNFFANYQGGASTRAGLKYFGTCKQPANAAPPRDINFQYNINQGYALEFGDQYMRIKSNGAYVTEATKNITGITQANPGVITVTGHGYSNGNQVFISGIVGMIQLNGLIWTISNVTTNTFTLIDMFGNIVNTALYSTYISGGTVARIYTVVSPYAAVDLPYLKFTQSANVMSMTCVNTVTGTEYLPYDLQRVGTTNWTFTQTLFSSIISAPASVSAVATSSTTVNTWYSYVVTAIDANGNESVASVAAAIENNDISVNAGSNTITWSSVSGAISYNIYAAIPSYSAVVPIGVSFGFIGAAFGTQFVDTNITADFNKTPPTHQEPFARGQIDFVNITAPGTGYSQSTVGFTITTSTGTGFAGVPIVVSGAVVAFFIDNNGKNYANTDTITITGGTGATATMNFGAQTGTYPGAVSYFQQRRGYAATLNAPDTYFFSKTGLYTNMDFSTPTTADDAIVGTPWAQQINGIQWMIQMPNGLIVLTGNGAWLLTGANSGVLTPSSQQAIQQANIGCSALVEPILINSDILYVQAKNSVIRDLTYNFYTNIYMGEDKTILANHLVFGHTITQWAYAEEPFKIIWALRDDGILLSLTWLKEQDIWAWARHDTDGIVVSVCTVTEPPVDAVYVIVKRFINGQYLYYSERMDNRIWQNVEQCFCVDAGLSYPMGNPNATLTAASASGNNNISGINVIFGGTGYTSPVATAVDSTGVGTGATFSVAVVNGTITTITPITQGANYTLGFTEIIITDSTGVGGIAAALITNNVMFTASASIFSSGNIGNVIRMGGGKATVTSYLSGTQVMANITQPITGVITDNLNNMPIPATPGNWSLSVPTTVVTGLNHLAGEAVSILSDGSVVAPQIVTNNSITLPDEGSAIAIGLPFTAQLQTMYLEPPGQPMTTQSKRKSIAAVVVRVESTRGISIGVNQPDASTQPNEANVPWTNLVQVKDRGALNFPGNAVPLQTTDFYTEVLGDYEFQGQVAIETRNPLPANILACISYYTMGDTSG